jgi:formylglycine-generating enzyme required for sulfatase activity
MSNIISSLTGKTAIILRNCCIILLFTVNQAFAQGIEQIGIEATRGLITGRIYLADNSTINLEAPRPLFSFLLNGRYCTSADYEAVKNDSVFSQTVDGTLKITFRLPDAGDPDWACGIIFKNTGSDTLIVSNVVPYGEDKSSVYITGHGPAGLARACLFRPGYRPVRVILPDNAWELGYSSFSAGHEQSLCGLTRRTKTDGAIRKRYETLLVPGSSVTYTMYTSLYKGTWQDGIRKVFRDKYLYDISKFDYKLYERNDLTWIRESYLIILQMAWDREFYDRLTGKYTYPELLKTGIQDFGKIDVYGIWPTWPRLGLDRRNQWDLYRDLPGGIAQLGNFVKLSHSYGTRFFIAYNPWDNSTRKEDHYRGMAKLIKETDADGVVLDTRGNSSYELQAAADSVRKGVVMFSEGMAVVKDMPGIISGRVHNAIFLSPELNLNKLIKPDFAIFRVCDVGEDLIHRETAISFFNGYGTELNMFRPGGRNDDFRADMDYLARTTFILRQNNDAFLDKNWTPLIETATDNIFVNRWQSGEKTIYTVLNLRQEGFSGKLFQVPVRQGRHYVSLWNHENLIPGPVNGKTMIPVKTEGWPSDWSGTRKEGSVDCIAEFPEILRSELINGDSVKINYPGSGKLVLWKGNPSYKAEKKELKVISDTIVSVRNLFGYYEGKLVIQLIVNERLADENVINVRGGEPWLISRITRSVPAAEIPADMVLVPGRNFSFEVSPTDNFIPYPAISNKIFQIDSFLIDKFPVTNAQYYEFIMRTGYRPADTTRYLRHWVSGMYKQGQDKYPVVYISYEDAVAYARWAEKRLPSEAEWQLAAQGPDKRKWPWGNEFHATNCNNAFDRPTPVDAFTKGQSPYGALDMVGNVWQMTGDMYFNSTNYFITIRGGSFYHPESGSWYIEGGPQPLDRTQIMLLVSPGFDRSETVGFRCVRDIDPKNFRSGK